MEQKRKGTELRTTLGTAQNNYTATTTQQQN
jgi:hypothetical protein